MEVGVSNRNSSNYVQDRKAMEELVKKFKSNRLSASELAKFRLLVGKMSDEELEQLFQQYGREDAESGEVSDDEIAGILARLRGRIASERLRAGRPRRRVPMVAAAAVVLVLAGVVAWLYVSLGRYSRYDQLLSSGTEIRTGVDERVSVKLPDGTDAEIGSDSYVRYSMRDFNDRERIIDGGGELKLSVAHDGGCPFYVRSRGLEVKVVGTRFILVAREGSDSAMLYLEEGAVEMRSTATGDAVRIHPQEMAIMDYRTGRLRVENIDNGNDAMAMMRGDMAFTGVALGDVLSRVGEAYGVRFVYAEDDVAGKVFTGYVPSTDLEEATGILTEVFNLRAEMSGGDVILRGE